MKAMDDCSMACPTRSLMVAREAALFCASGGTLS